MIRRLAVLLGVALAVRAGATAASAIETATFGIDVVEADPEGRLHIELEAGEHTSGQLRVWNKQSQSLVLRLSVAPATVDENGTASLGGDPEPVTWVKVTPAQVTLAPGEHRVVDVRVESPRKLAAGRKTVAVLAEPVFEGPAPAVLERLAVTTYLEPRSGSLVAGLGLLPWIAAAILAVAVVLGARELQ